MKNFKVNTSDNVALYDNSGATPNLTSPGADRLRITLTLKKEADKTAGKTFYPLMKLNQGYVVNVNTPPASVQSLAVKYSCTVLL